MNKTETRRRQLIRILATSHGVRSQQDLALALRDYGHRATQATVSRDLAAIAKEYAQAGNRLITGS